MSPAIRQRIYLAATGILGILVVWGVITPEAAPLWLDLTNAVLGVGVALVALRNLDDTSWSRFRAAFYAVMGAASVALATIGITIDERWPAMVSQVFTILAAILAVSNVDDSPPAR